MKTYLRIAVGLGIAVLLLRTYWLQGVFVPVRVESGSMVPALVGPHYSLNCEACGFSWAVDAEASHAPFLDCPNCGNRQSEISAPLQAGRRVSIDRTAWLCHAPRHGELVAYRAADRPDELILKRIVGLPGETVELRDGDLWIDGRVYTKSPAEQQAVAIPIHDDRFRPEYYRSLLGWDSESYSPWKPTDDGWRIEPSEKTEWLTFRLNRHPANTASLGVQDVYPYNVGLSRRLNRVRDLRLTCRIAARGEGTLRVEVRLPNNDWLLEFEPDVGSLQLRLNSVSQEPAVDAARSAAIRRLLSGAVLTVSTFDRQLLVLIDKTVIAEHPLLPFDGLNEQSNVDASAGSPFSIGAERLGVEITKLQVWRDIYYTEAPPGGFGSTPLLLPADGYFLLGDNSPLSEDCRHPAIGPAIDANWFVGKVLALPPQ